MLYSQRGGSRNYMQDTKDAHPRCNITEKKSGTEQECVRCDAS
jgi:hypothetical protein